MFLQRPGECFQCIKMHFFCANNRFMDHACIFSVSQNQVEFMWGVVNVPADCFVQFLPVCAELEYISQYVYFKIMFHVADSMDSTFLTGLTGVVCIVYEQCSRTVLYPLHTHVSNLQTFEMFFDLRHV